MFCFEFEGKRPTVPEDFVEPTATPIGDATVERGAGIWYGAVRADPCPIVVREGANAQDDSVLHAAPGHTLVIGRPAQRHRAGAPAVQS